MVRTLFSQFLQGNPPPPQKKTEHIFLTEIHKFDSFFQDMK